MFGLTRSRMYLCLANRTRMTFMTDFSDSLRPEGVGPDPGSNAAKWHLSKGLVVPFFDSHPNPAVGP